MPGLIYEVLWDCSGPPHRIRRSDLQPDLELQPQPVVRGKLWNSSQWHPRGACRFQRLQRVQRLISTGDRFSGSCLIRRCLNGPRHGNSRFQAVEMGRHGRLRINNKHSAPNNKHLTIAISNNSQHPQRSGNVPGKLSKATEDDHRKNYGTKLQTADPVHAHRHLNRDAADSGIDPVLGWSYREHSR